MQLDIYIYTICYMIRVTTSFKRRCRALSLLIGDARSEGAHAQDFEQRPSGHAEAAAAAPASAVAGTRLVGLLGVRNPGLAEDMM